jgi:hypothetical protein
VVALGRFAPEPEGALLAELEAAALRGREMAQARLQAAEKAYQASEPAQKLERLRQTAADAAREAAAAQKVVPTAAARYSSAAESGNAETLLKAQRALEAARNKSQERKRCREDIDGQVALAEREAQAERRRLLEESARAAKEEFFGARDEVRRKAAQAAAAHLAEHVALTRALEHAHPAVLAELAGSGGGGAG